VLDFKEIEYNPKFGDPDSFEKFCADFLKVVGYEILEIPSRGADGGLDLKVKDGRRKPDGELRTKDIWLVSCKHYAQSNRNVGLSDEQSIYDRIIQHGCTAFMGFYSTGPTKSLIERLKGLKIPFIIYYDRKIEDEIIGLYSRENIFMRYFPESYKKWKLTSNIYEPENLFTSLIDTKYIGIKDFLISSFGSLLTAMKQIRQHSSFKEIFEKNNITYGISDIIPEISKSLIMMFNDFLGQYPNGLQGMLDDCDNKMPGFLPPGPEAVFALMSNFIGVVIQLQLQDISRNILYSIGITGINQMPIQLSLGFDNLGSSKSINDYCVFTNFFVCSNACHKNLEEYYKSIKEDLS
jgi:hypothetical protein